MVPQPTLQVQGPEFDSEYQKKVSLTGVSVDRWVTKMWYIHAMEYYSAFKN